MLKEKQFYMKNVRGGQTDKTKGHKFSWPDKQKANRNKTRKEMKDVSQDMVRMRLHLPVMLVFILTST